MKTQTPHFFRNAAAFLVLFIFSSSLFTQPQYYNYQNVGTSNNSFPFNVANGKEVEWLIPANSLIQPSPLPSGNQIIKVYFFTVSAATPTYSQLMIRLGQSSITSLPTGSWYAGQLDTHYYRASVSLTSTANGWMSITLDRPFVYDPTLSLIVEVSQCATSGTGPTVRQNTIGSNTRSYSGTTGCPNIYSGQDGNIINFGVDVVPAVSPPDYLFYKFENNPTTSSVLNCAIPGVGTSPAAMTGLTLTPGGQFDSCITGAGVTSAGIVTGWNNNLGTSSWTISMWIDCNTTTFGYLFGDGGGSFRCFNNGAAGTGGITLRGTGITNVDVPNVNTGPVVIHFVYDSAAANIKVYRNGVLSITVAQTPLNLAAGTGFKVGGYTTVAGFTGKMDEFRLYRRALGSTEISATWNQDISCGTIVSVPNTNNQVPSMYSLEQNYPNPFNPITNIKFSIPTTGLVKLVVYDILGREVNTLLNEVKPAGNYLVDFDASHLSSGVYFYTITSGDFRDTKKMLLVK